MAQFLTGDLMTVSATILISALTLCQGGL